MFLGEIVQNFSPVLIFLTKKSHIIPDGVKIGAWTLDHSIDSQIKRRRVYLYRYEGRRNYVTQAAVSPNADAAAVSFFTTTAALSASAAIKREIKSLSLSLSVFLASQPKEID